jgi:hypothetical protein
MTPVDYSLPAEPSTPEGKHARELYATLEDRLAEQARVNHAARTAKIDVRQAERDLERALTAQATGAKVTAAEISSLTKAVDQARANAAQPWDVRARAAATAARVAESEYRKFMAQHAVALMAEFEADAHAARERVLSAVAEARQAIADYGRLANRVGSVLSHAPHLDGRDVQTLPADAHDLTRAAQRLTEDTVPLPLPSPAVIDWWHAHTSPATQDEAEEGQEVAA